MYKIGTYITDPIGNNEFSYQERIALGSVGESPASLGKIFVPDLIKGTVADLELGSEIVFEEVENGVVKSHSGLKHFVQLEYEGIPVYIVDNHNHALSFRYQHRELVGLVQHVTVIHIDQHADTKPCDTACDIKHPEKEAIEDFVNHETNVGNFITAAVNSGIVNEVMQIRTEYALQQLKISNNHNRQIDESHEGHIVDIDMDFWDGRDDYEEDFDVIRSLIAHAKLVTIATSPHFFDQQKAIELIKKLLI